MFLQMRNLKKNLLLILIFIFVAVSILPYKFGVTRKLNFNIHEAKEDSSAICRNKSFQTLKLSDQVEVNVPGFHRILNNKCANKSNSVKNIFSFHHLFMSWTEDFEKSLFENCPVKNCVLNHIKNSSPIEDYDAIIFYLLKPTNLSRRTANQNYVFYTLESPYNTLYATDLYKSPWFFNLTMNYRRDSDVHLPYGRVSKNQTNYTLPSPSTILNKKRMVAWFVSNFDTAGTKRRMKYVEQLQMYIQVDIYSKHRPLKCPTDWNCYEMLETDYMFYLAFENSMCYDYITEKVFHVLRYNVIPVVMGHAHYKSMVPPNSVIDVNDFPTPKSLSEHLIKVSQNPILYQSYLEWKREFVVESNEVLLLKHALCQLCDLLHRPLNHSSYENVYDWYFSQSCYQ